VPYPIYSLNFEQSSSKLAGRRCAGLRPNSAKSGSGSGARLQFAVYSCERQVYKPNYVSAHPMPSAGVFHFRSNSFLKQRLNLPSSPKHMTDETFVTSSSNHVAIKTFHQPFHIHMITRTFLATSSCLFILIKG
jgi:hypothetical protein